MCTLETLGDGTVRVCPDCRPEAAALIGSVSVRAELAVCPVLALEDCDERVA